MTTVDLLLKVTGGKAYLGYADLAAVLNRSPNGLKTILGQDNDLSRKLLPFKMKVGQRIYFSVLDVAKVLDEAKVES